jgi:hypothetical membrane protein
MRTLDVSSKEMIGAAMIRPWTVQKVLLACGIVSSLLYVITNVVGAMRWEGYSSTSQAISELFAIGAPSTPLVVPLLIVYTMLLYTFGVGVWRSAGGKRALRVAAVLIIGKEVFGLVATVVTPMHMRGAEATLTDTLHATFTMVGVFLCMLPAMAFGATAFGKQFRFYTIGTIVVFVLCGVWAFLDAPQIGANLATPWLGVQERINAYSYMLWIAVLSITLLRGQPNNSRLEVR